MSAYGSSARVLGAGAGDSSGSDSGSGSGGGSGTNFESNTHTRKRRARSASTPTSTPAAAATTTAVPDNSNSLSASHQDNGSGGGGEDESGERECAAATAVEELCSALGVPSVQDVAASGPAMAMVRAWGRQFAGAFGPAQPGAGVCGIGSEVRTCHATGRSWANVSVWPFSLWRTGRIIIMFRSGC